MKAYLIAPDNRRIEETTVDTLADIQALIGFDTLEIDQIGDSGDRLYFDEECFLRGADGRFQIDSLIPVSGKGVITGPVDAGAVTADAVIGIDELRERIKYL